MAKRDWSKLSDSQRKRYVGAGKSGTLTGTPGRTAEQVRKYYEGGGDLSFGRGHAPKGAAPRKVTGRVTKGLGTTDDLKQLAAWRKRNAPDWIPKNNATMKDDTAAALSLIGVKPSSWKRVSIRQNVEGDFTMTVTTKRGITHVVILPDRDSVSEVTRLLKTPNKLGKTKKENATLEQNWSMANGEPYAIEVEVFGYVDPKASPTDLTVPTKKQGQALPRKKK